MTVMKRYVHHIHHIPESPLTMMAPAAIATQRHTDESLPLPPVVEHSQTPVVGNSLQSVKTVTDKPMMKTPKIMTAADRKYK